MFKMLQSCAVQSLKFSARSSSARKAQNRIAFEGTYCGMLSSPPIEGGITLSELTIFLDILIVWLFNGVLSYSQWHARSDFTRFF